MKTCIVLLLALSAAALVSGRVFHEDGASRSLLQTPANAFCPVGCDRANGGCVQDATMAGLRCQKCLGTLVVNKVNGNCSCPAGKYATYNAVLKRPECTDCAKGYYCPGGDYVEGTQLLPKQEECPGASATPATMTTLGKRSSSNRACVNMPGYFYTISADGLTVNATNCPVDTYSPGLKKQRACVPCPTGFTTNGLDTRTRPADCLVPAGYYLKAPGQVAPCPKGEYKEEFGPRANCTKCAFGVTTPSEGSISVDNCTLLMAGYYAGSMNGAIVTNTIICPQKYYCPGGYPTAPFNASNPSALSPTEPSIKACPQGTWTIEPGSSIVDQCLTPPGHYTNATDTYICPSGSYRADWKPADQAADCISCGVGVKADKTDQLKVYDITDATRITMLPITTSADDCYIMPGQGLYYTSTTATWRARNCDTDNYGVANKTYGLTPSACRDCPTGMVANATTSDYPNSASYFVNNGDGTQGFINVKACVTKDGFGYNGRIAQPCGLGYYNRKDTQNDCTQCPYGLTTSNVGAGVTIADCGMAAGFGVSGGAIRPCSIGTYNNESWVASTTAVCSACPDGTTTTVAGADHPEQCNLCIAGRGGLACNQTCGSTDAPGTYGIPGRAIDTECAACSTQTTGYSFEWNLANDVYAVSAISPSGANSSVDCLSEFAQMVDGAWYLPTLYDNSTTPVYNVLNFSACVALCNNYSCEFITYDYQNQSCHIKTAATQVLVGAPVIGFKAVPAGDVGTSAWSLRKKKSSAEGKAVASGRYTFYQEPRALEVGDRYQPADVQSFTKWQDCLNSCDDDPFCAGFTIELTVNVANRPKTCNLFKGRTDVGEFKRTMTRADIDHLSIPALK